VLCVRQLALRGSHKPHIFSVNFIKFIDIYSTKHKLYIRVVGSSLQSLAFHYIKKINRSICQISLWKELEISFERIQICITITILINYPL
jgi:hypothetical protein